ncbi:MAG: hypothetical protein ACLFUF_02650 [Opitutales bacterium]
MKASTIIEALRRLGQLAEAQSIKLEISIYGGSAFLLAYNSREGTKDIDALLKPREEGERLATRVARELDLPEDWINRNVVQFISPKIESKRRLAAIEEATGLIVHVPTADYLLAMKALACRRPIGEYRGDLDDLDFLIRKMKIRSLDQIQEAVDRFYPDDLIRPQDRALLQTLIDQNHA